MHNNNARRRIWIIHFHAIFPSDKSLSRIHRVENLTAGERRAICFVPPPSSSSSSWNGTKRDGGREGGLWTSLLRDLALCIRRQAIARPRKIHGLARGEQMPPPSRPSLAGSLLRSAAIPSYYRNIRFNGERQGITMRDTAPKRAIFHPGIFFFLSSFLPSSSPPFRR